MSFWHWWVAVTRPRHVGDGSADGFILEGRMLLLDFIVTIRKRTYCSLVRMKEEVDYEFRLTHMLLCLWCSILDGHNLQGLILTHGNLCCFDYPFRLTWFSTQYDYLRKSLDFEHIFWERTSLLLNFVPWNCLEAYLISSRDCGWF